MSKLIVRPRVSVVMPFRRRDEMIKEAIESIVTQTFSDFELLCVCDDQADSLSGSAFSFTQSDPRVRIVVNKNGPGITNALNAGIAEARGDFIARMDSDDISLQSRLATQVRFLDENPDVALCGTWVRTFGIHKGNEWKLPTTHDEIAVWMLFYGALAHPTVMFRRARFEALGLRYEASVAEDYDLWQRASRRVRLANIPQILLRYRTHDESASVVRREEGYRAVRKVHARQIRALGIAASASELDLHWQISDWRLVKDNTFRRAAMDWLAKIEAANQTTKIFDRIELRKFLERKRQDIGPPEYDQSSTPSSEHLVRELLDAPVSRSAKARSAVARRAALARISRQDRAASFRPVWRRDYDLIQNSGLFYPNWYRTEYPDVSAARVDPLLHYVRYGWIEGRSPSPEFDARWYLNNNPDVEASRVNPLAHYLRHGAAEGRAPALADLILSKSPAAQATTAPSDGALSGSLRKIAALLQPSRHPDFELVRTSGYFDGMWYKTTYPDVKDAGADPLWHFMRHGWKEGRSPSPEFNTAWYLLKYPDVAQAAVNPLLHFLKHGAAEGRIARENEAIGDWKTVFAPVKSLREPFKIGIAILVRGPAERLRISLDSLFTTNLHGYDVTFVLIDDGSTDPDVRAIVEKPRDGRYNIIRLHMPKTASEMAVISRASQILKQINYFDIMGLLAADLKFDPDWLRQTIELGRWVKLNRQEQIVGSFSCMPPPEAPEQARVEDSPHGRYILSGLTDRLHAFYFRWDLDRLGELDESIHGEMLGSEQYARPGFATVALERPLAESLRVADAVAPNQINDVALSSPMPVKSTSPRHLQAVQEGEDWQPARALPPRYKIGMAILIHDRAEYLEKCLDTLFETNLYDYDITFLLMDDGSLEPDVREFMEKRRDPKYKIVRRYTQKGPNNWGAAFNKAMRLLLEIDDFDVIGSSDSDALFHPEWLDQLMKIATWAKRNHSAHLIGPFSAFNSSDRDFHEWQGIYDSPHGQYVIKRRMGALNYLYFREDLQRLGFFEEHRDDETIMTRRFNKLGVLNLSTLTSYVEHIGQESILNRWRPTAVTRAVYGLNLEPKGWPKQLETVETVGYFEQVKGTVTVGPDAWSDVPLDIIYVCTEDDAPVLKASVEGIKRNLRHPIGEILMIAPPNDGIRTIAPKLGCRYVCEDEVLPIKKADIRYIVPGYLNIRKEMTFDRSGWLFQQILKLGADAVTDKSHYLVMDGDTVLVKPQVFIKDDKDLLLHAFYFHHPYIEAYMRLVRARPKTLVTSVVHHMLYNRLRLDDVKRHMAAVAGMEWYHAIISAADLADTSGFSEYETYGQWCVGMYPSKTLREYAFNVSVPRGKLDECAALEKQYGSDYRSVSLHWYLD